MTEQDDTRIIGSVKDFDEAFKEELKTPQSAEQTPETESQESPETPETKAESDTQSPDVDEQFEKFINKLKEGDVYDENHPLNKAFKEKFGNDAVGDVKHPYHKIVADNQRKLSEVTRRAKELEEQVQQYAGMLKQTPESEDQDDPDTDTYGGISREMVKEDPSLGLDWIEAKENYNKRRVLKQQQELEAKRIGEQMENERNDFQARHSAEALAELESNIYTHQADGKPNPNFKPINHDEGYLVVQVRKAGSVEKFIAGKTKEAYEKGRAEALKEISKLGTNQHLRSDDNDLVGNASKAETPEQILAIPKDEWRRLRAEQIGMPTS